LKIFKDILKHTLFFVPAIKDEETELNNIKSICSEYIYLLRLNILNKDLKDVDNVFFMFRIKLKKQRQLV
jgi:hypothetical protein